MRILRTPALLLLAATAAVAAGYKDGWTPAALAEAVKACSDELVDGAWANTKKEAGVDPDLPMTAEMRKDLAPQIAAFEKLCDCVVRESARKFGREAYRANGKEIDEYAVALIEKGTCKAPAH